MQSRRNCVTMSFVRRLGRRGLTVGELMVASALLGMIMVTMMIMFGQMMATSSKNTMLAAGSYLADGILENQITKAKDSNPSFVSVPLDSSQWVKTTDPNSQTEFLYRVEAEQIGGTPGGQPGEVWYVQVEVAWWQSGGNVNSQAYRAGYGKLNLKRGRVIYVQRD